MPRPRTPSVLDLAIAAAVLVQPLAPGRVVAQEPTEEEAPVAQEFEGVSPGGAFLRAIVLPGWGHASIESYTRGGFYFLTETASFWMIGRSQRRLSDARDVARSREAILEASLRDMGLSEEEIADALDEDPGVVSARRLVEGREQQRQDWIALGVFLVLLSGADAFVSAHLKDFPTPVAVIGGATEHGFEVGVRIPVGHLP